MNPVETQPVATKSGADTQRVHPSVLMMSNGDDVPKGPPALSAAPTMSALWQAFRRRWPLALGLAILASALTVAAVFVILPPKYHVAMRLRIAKQPGIDESNHVIYTANMEALAKSPLVLNRALNDRTEDGRDIGDLELVRAKGMGAAEWLEKSLKTDYKLGPEVLRVTLPADQPEEASELLNAVARAFMAEFGEMERSKKQGRLTELRAKKAVTEDQLNSLRKIYLKQLEALDVKDREQLLVVQQQWIHKLAAAESIKRSNQDEIVKADNKIIVAKARIESLDNQEAPDDVLIELFSKDLTIQVHLKRLAEIEDEIGRIYREFNEPLATQKAVPLKHAKVELRDQLKDRETQLKPGLTKLWRDTTRRELRNQISVAEVELAEHHRRRDGLVKETADLERKVKESGPGGGKLPPTIQATEDKIEMEKVALSQTALKISEVELDQPASRLTLMQKATSPLERDKSQQTKIAGAGGLGMFVFVLFAVALLEFRTRKIGDADEVATGLGIKVLGTAPALPSGSGGQVAPAWQEHLHESMDAVRTVLLRQARGEKLHVLLITSAARGEGKTTLASQLAASLARAWKRVLLIDGDLRQPAAHRLFDAPQEPGLAEVLRGEVEPADAIRATAFSRLWLLPAGNGDAHAIQALAQDSVRTLFEQLKQQYDFVLIDAPAVLPVTDSLLLGQHVDGILFAVLRDVSRAPAIHAAQQKLEPLGVATLGAVVLGADSEFGGKGASFAKN